MIDRKELKSKIPHGGCREIAQKAGVTPSEVSLYLNEKRNSEKVEMATLEYLAELSQRKKRLLAQIL